MKYFTRELLELSQQDNFSPATWAQVLKAYKRRLQRVMLRMPAKVRRLTNAYFHDCRVRGISFSTNNRLEIGLRGCRH